MENKEVLKISSDVLDELIDYCAKTTVGKVLKRIEICQDINQLKTNTKELLYEEYRAFKALLKMHAKSLDLTIIEFKPKEKSA